MKNKFNIGDLVQLKKHCKDRNRAAMVLNYNGYQATIVFIDNGDQVHALPANLEFLDESR
jgi:hypothetical protein